MKISTESAITRILEPGERIIWSGRPHIEATRAVNSGRRLLVHLAVLGALIFPILWLFRVSGVTDASSAVGLALLEPRFMIPIVVVLLLLVVPRMFRVDPAARLHRYFDSLTYAITDRRLLILEGDKVSDAYAPERLREPRIRERAPGYADVIFDERPTETADRYRSRDPVFLERAEVGFKSLRNASEVRQILVRWVDDHLRQAASSVAEFVMAEPAAAETEVAAGAHNVRHPTLGLVLRVPETWAIKVRQKKRPQGKFAWDAEHWQELGAADEWNVIRIEGPDLCKVEAEVFETEPTVRFNELANSKLADSLSGKVIESRNDYEVNGVKGFYVTRRNDLRVDPTTGKAGIAAVVAPERQTVLHDGRRQVCIVSTWPEDSPELERAVQTIVESIELH